MSMSTGSSDGGADGESLARRLERQIADLEARHRIGPDKYCGLTPEELSRAVVACHGGLHRPGEPVGFWPGIPQEAREGALREAFGTGADVERLRVMVQFFDQRVAKSLAVDWALPGPEFDRAVWKGLEHHYPELSDDARRVIAGNYSYSHAK